MRIGKFYADLFEAAFLIHPLLSGLGVVIVKVANPESVFRGIVEFWPLDIQWDGATGSIRRIPGGLPPMQNHVAFRVDLAKEEIFELLTLRGIAARYEPRSGGVVIVGFDDPDGNFVELFPNIETTELPPQASCDAQELDLVMAECRALLDRSAEVDEHAKLFIHWSPAKRRHCPICSLGRVWKICGGAGIKRLWNFALSQDFRRPAAPRGLDQILSSLGSDARVQICEFTDLRCTIRQIGQLVQHNVRFEVTNRLDKCLPVEDITKNRFGAEVAQ